MYKRRYHKNRLILFGAFVFAFFAAFAFLSTKNQAQTEAASTSNFRAGNIISDAVMTDYNSMTVAQIQSFLKSKNACNMPADIKSAGAIRYENVNETKHGIKYNRRYYFNTSSGVKSGLYHVENNKFVCMADEKINGQSAAYIIWDAAQSFKINPKVLIVLLEKEQSLVTDKWPYEVQYRAATGYGCPDSAACDSKYYGLEAQVGNAAYLFMKIVYENKWNNYPVGKNYVKYHYNTACGGSTVNIENRATGALYTYTPYQPNAASLAAGYGTTSDGCGAYGNRNFFLLYSDWFGDPHATTKSPAIQVPKSTLNIANGIYTLSSASNWGFVVDISNASVEDKANVQLWQWNTTIAQKFMIMSNSKGYYYIANLKSGKFLTVDRKSNNTVIQDSYDEDEQNKFLWSISGNDREAVFTSVESGLVLDVSNNKMSNGSNIQLWSKNGTSAQKFKLSKFSNINNIDTDKNKDNKLDTFTIISKVTEDKKHVIDVNQANNINGTNIQLWYSNKTNAQKFTLENLGNGFYRIIASTGTDKDNNPMVLDVTNARGISGTNVQLWKWNGSLAQQWALSSNGDNTYSIVSRCNGLALDISNRGIANGTNIQIWERNNTPAQKFILERN